MDFLGPILEILKCIGPPLWKNIEYHRKLEEYKKEFQRILDELNSQKNEIEQRLRTESGFGKLPKNEVNIWLKDVEVIINGARSEHVVKKGKCFSRMRLAKTVDQKIQEMKECRQRGYSFNTLVIDAPPPRGIILPTTTLAGETTAMDEIWRHLMGNEVKKIGVWGMGGVGKTTIIMHINNRLIGENKFQHVIWVTVSQTPDFIQIQNGIASALKQSLPSVEDQKRRTGMLLNMLRDKRFVMILDDVWKEIRLEELGIPEPTEENGCKLVITTRSLNVCRQMGCNTIQVKPLSENEAFKLFLEKAELDILKAPTLKEIVELVVKHCAGLPLAIVTVASSMKGEKDILEWRNALNELSDNIRSIKIDMDDEVFGRLKFSYDRLKDEKIQGCFLYCALYPEDYDILKSELVDCWIAEGLVDDMHNVQATEDRAHIIIKILINNCLLLESTDMSGRSCVKLHDVVRDMISKYITSKSPLFMTKAGLELRELPNGQEWKENLDKVSLMKNSIIEIPSSMSPNCEVLSTLLLQDNPLESIPEAFFYHMLGLKILNLSETRIQSLPNSISELTNLTALLLNDCKRLKRVPSLAKLRALRKLELGYTRINEVPAGMEMLTNLTSLDLYLGELSKLPAGMFPKLCRLQNLRVYWGLETRLQKLGVYLGLETRTVAIKEVAQLKNLNRLAAEFRNLQDFNCYAKSINSHGGPNEYSLYLNPKIPYYQRSIELRFNECRSNDWRSNDWEPNDWRFYEYGVNKMVIVEGCNICGREEDSILLPRDVESLLIRCCDDVRNISDIPTFNTLERLEILRVSYLDNLTVLLNVWESSSPAPYSHLKGVRIYHCAKLKRLFSSKQLSELENLESIEVYLCNKMKKLIAVDDYEKEERGQKEFLLPKLKKLSLEYMPKLKKIISTSKLQLEALKNLEEIHVISCAKVEEIIAFEDVDEEETSKKELIILPKLRKLTLHEMRELKRIINICGSNGVMVCDSLQEVSIWWCPQLKRLPLHLPVDEKGQPSPPPALNKIHVYREWWEALEWDHLHPDAKTLLLPFCNFDW